MKTINYRKYLKAFLHLLFWLLSVNAWYFVFNPGVESSGIVKGVDDFWVQLVGLNTLFFLYILLPFTWLLKKTGKWLKIAATVIFLVPALYLVSQWILPGGSKDDLTFFRDFFCSTFLYVVVFHLPLLLSVYLNLRFLIPRYLNQSRTAAYFVSVAFLLLLASGLNFVLFDFGTDKIFPALFFISYFKFPELLLINSGYLIMTTLLYLFWHYAMMLMANREKAQNELSALKGQINPHFLFNNLNTIYSLVTTNDRQAGNVILQLSDFLRYVLYDSASEKIPLSKEVESIRTYVELQKGRLDPDFTKLDFQTEGDFSGLEIAPLLLLPLAENCFKHGVGKEPGKIQIHIETDRRNLSFSTTNTIVSQEIREGENMSGIGIKNVRKRLELQYPGKHSFHYEAKEGIFYVRMTLNLPG